MRLPAAGTRARRRVAPALAAAPVATPATALAAAPVAHARARCRVRRMPAVPLICVSPSCDGGSRYQDHCSWCGDARPRRELPGRSSTARRPRARLLRNAGHIGDFRAFGNHPRRMPPGHILHLLARSNARHQNHRLRLKFAGARSRRRFPRLTQEHRHTTLVSMPDPRRSSCSSSDRRSPHFSPSSRFGAARPPDTGSSAESGREWMVRIWRNQRGSWSRTRNLISYQEGDTPSRAGAPGRDRGATWDVASFCTPTRTTSWSRWRATPKTPSRRAACACAALTCPRS